jgi:hypothetical protein
MIMLGMYVDHVQMVARMVPNNFGFLALEDS